ncbi:MAG TPA: tRNA (adenosine(37)-N6)-dimethylallyltransferase MiaA [Candidatus Enteromonas pullicola]|uniref:tRNA dimethylallyltransferase n=1 Tax=Candidatus Alloenteromonas pullicola TaxID=2840784 RepID=A0A9D1LMT6_9FIRM|nr:tRNA (adenosine(37)-N6)-dimethylallyltransferase MiaA [Candidatus Enteromonas pullicola]
MIIVLTGPTGTGKSELAIRLAKEIGGVIVNADAFQVYEELSIATAKPTPEMMMEVPHFLFDFVPLTSSYSVAEYQQDLRSAIATIGERPIILAGGTGLYIRAGLFDYEFPEEEEVDLRQYEAMDEESLYQAAKRLDEAEALSIHPNNRVRLLRLIKMALSGKKKSDIKSSQDHRPIFDCHFFGLQIDRDENYSRVDERVDRMFAMGLVDEVSSLVGRYGRTPSAFKAIGVKELFPYFDGQISLQQAKDEIKKNTRHYVKRQLTFFRHQFDLTWVEGMDDILRCLQ